MDTENGSSGSEVTGGHGSFTARALSEQARNLISRKVECSAEGQPTVSPLFRLYYVSTLADLFSTMTNAFEMYYFKNYFI